MTGMSGLELGLDKYRLQAIGYYQPGVDRLPNYFELMSHYDQISRGCHQLECRIDMG